MIYIVLSIVSQHEGGDTMSQQERADYEHLLQTRANLQQKLYTQFLKPAEKKAFFTQLYDLERKILAYQG